MVFKNLCVLRLRTEVILESERLTLSVRRLLCPKAHNRKHFLENPHLKAFAEYCQMNTNIPGLRTFSGILNYSIIGKLASSTRRVNLFVSSIVLFLSDMARKVREGAGPRVGCEELALQQETQSRNETLHAIYSEVRGCYPTHWGGLL